MTIDYAKAREVMVEQQVRPWDVLDPRVLETISRVPREAFVADARRALAYSDLELPIGHGETMLKPVLEGRALQALGLEQGESVLQIGTGSGYLAACLGYLARDVVSIERHADLADAARDRLTAQGIANVDVIAADAFTWHSDRQFDAICVGAAVDTIPERFLAWLRPGGRVFIVRGQAPAMEAVLATRTGDDVNAPAIESLFETELVYLAGAAPVPRFSL